MPARLCGSPAFPPAFCFQRGVQKNCMSLVRGGRLEQIQEEFPNYSLLSIQGTRFQMSRSAPVPIEQHGAGKWLEYHCNYGDKSNRHAGIVVCINRRFWNRSNVTAVSYPADVRLRGRAFALRLQRARVDMLIVSIYMPPFQNEITTAAHALNQLLQLSQQ